MIQVDWPFPPSVNARWRRSKNGGIYLDPAVRKFRAEVGKRVIAMRPKAKCIDGAFEAEIKLSTAHGRGDADNRIKETLDVAQFCGLITNDKYCKQVSIGWVDKADAPLGCRVTLRPIEDVS
jgi:Holliday junction resolvase RusA-like endonuclease